LNPQFCVKYLTQSHPCGIILARKAKTETSKLLPVDSDPEMV
jgi:hypothetical protein